MENLRVKSVGIRAHKLSPIDRLPIAVGRFIRATYSPPGKMPPYFLGFKPFQWNLLREPLITEIKRIPEHECRIGWMGSYDCCWGETHIIELTYAVQGYGATIGAHFDHKIDAWQFSVWQD